MARLTTTQLVSPGLYNVSHENDDPEIDTNPVSIEFRSEWPGDLCVHTFGDWQPVSHVFRGHTWELLEKYPDDYTSD